MQAIYQMHGLYMANLKPTFRRDFIDEIDWSNRLIAIKGARGVGKSTLILQHIKEVFGQSSEKALYVSLDNIAMRNISIYDLAQYHVDQGGTHLFLDEVHKYEDWSREIKTVYDLLPKLNLVITSSSMLQLYASYADLSRRMVAYDMVGLSFREFLQIEYDRKLPIYSLEQILCDHVEIAQEISPEMSIINKFKEYLTLGYYPFYLENKSTYPTKLNNTINLTLDIDLPYILGVNVQNIFKIKKLIYQLATQVPFQPNISKLAGSFELSRSTLSSYLHYLDNACILNLLMNAGKSYSKISKPEKIFLHNTNLSYAISPDYVDKGNLRETFFFNQLQIKHQVNSSKHGDFLVDEKYTFEIGGRGKNNKQIYDQPHSYIAADETLMGYRNKLPLWVFGFLY